MLRNETLRDISEDIRGILLLMIMARNACVSEDHRFVKMTIDSHFYNWLTHTTPAINPYQKVLDDINFPDELIPDHFRDPIDDTLHWHPEPALKADMDFFVAEVTKKVDAIRYRTTSSWFFCSPKPVSNDQYRDIRDNVMREMPSRLVHFSANPL